MKMFLQALESKKNVQKLNYKRNKFSCFDVEVTWTFPICLLLLTIGEHY